MIGRIKAEELEDCMPVAALARKRKKDVGARLRDLSRRRLRKLRNVFIPDQPGLECVPALVEDRDMEVVAIADDHLKSMASFVRGTKVSTLYMFGNKDFYPEMGAQGGAAGVSHGLEIFKMICMSYLEAS